MASELLDVIVTVKVIYVQLQPTRRKKIDYIVKDTSMVTIKHINLFFSKRKGGKQSIYIHTHSVLFPVGMKRKKRVNIYTACCEF